MHKNIFGKILIIIIYILFASGNRSYAQIAPVPVGSHNTAIATVPVVDAVSSVLSSTLNPPAPSVNTDPAALTLPKQDAAVDKLIQEKIRNGNNDEPAANVDVERPKIEAKVETGLESKIYVEHIIVEGAELLTEQEINNIISKYEKKNLTISEVKDVVREINNLYLDYGVLTALAYLPPQDVENNTVIIKVVEGKIGKINITGNKFTRPGYIRGAMHQKEGDVIYLPEIKQDILAFNKNNDVKLRVRVKKGEEFGTSDLTIETYEENPYHLGFSLDNTGSETVGILKGGVTARHDSLLGYRDRFTAGYIRARSTNIAMASYDVPVGYRGTRVGGAFSYGGIGISRGDLKDANIEGNSFGYSLFASQPILNTKRFSLGATASFNIKNSTTYMNGLSMKDWLENLGFVGADPPKIRTLVLSLNAAERDKTGQWIHNSDFTTGLDLFGGNESFFKYNGSLIRLQRITPRVSLILKGMTQLTTNRLTPAEQFSVGGSYSVRGFNEGRTSGDLGYLFSSELRFPLIILPQQIYNLRLRDSIQGIAFAETGGCLIKDYLGEEHNITSVGLGLRVGLTKYLTGRIDYGFGLINKNDDTPLAKLHFGLESNPF